MGMRNTTNILSLFQEMLISLQKFLVCLNIYLPVLLNSISNCFHIMFVSAALVANSKLGNCLPSYDLFVLILQLEADKKETYRQESLAKRNVYTSFGKGDILLSVRRGLLHWWLWNLMKREVHRWRKQGEAYFNSSRISFISWSHPLPGKNTIHFGQGWTVWNFWAILGYQILF